MKIIGPMAGSAPYLFRLARIAHTILAILMISARAMTFPRCVFGELTLECVLYLRDLIVELVAASMQVQQDGVEPRR